MISLKSFITSIGKSGILLFLLGIHFFLLKYVTQPLSQQPVYHLPNKPIKVTLVNSFEQPSMKSQQTLKRKSEPKKTATTKTTDASKSKNPKRIVIPRNLSGEKVRQTAVKKPEHLSKQLTAVKPAVVKKSATVSKKEFEQMTSPPKTTPIPTSQSTVTPVSNAKENLPRHTKTQQKPVVKQHIYKKNKPVSREQGETTNPAYQGNPLKPPYPRLSRKRGEEGTVRLRVQVNANGIPRVVSVVKSSGYSRLDNAAVQHVKRWHFKPAKRNGKAVNGTVIIPIRFRLK